MPTAAGPKVQLRELGKTGDYDRHIPPKWNIAMSHFRFFPGVNPFPEEERYVRSPLMQAFAFVDHVSRGEVCWRVVRKPEVI